MIDMMSKLLYGQCSKKPIAVVIGGGNYNELGLIRSCGEAGMKVIFLSLPNNLKPVNKSRYVSEFVEYDGGEGSMLSNLNRIYNKYKSESGDIYIFPATDIAAKYLDSNYFTLKNQFHISNAKGDIERLMDKEYQCALSLGVGIKTPCSLKIDLEGNIVLPRSINYPCIVKPLRSIAGLKRDISVCRNEEDIFTVLRKFKENGCPRVLVQEYITGSHQTEIAIPGVSTEQGEVLVHGIIRKKRTYGNGSTVYGKYVVDEKIPHLGEIKKFIKSTGYVGLFDIEFLENDNGVYFIECNFRNGAYGYVVTDAGFNMPATFAGIVDYTKLKLRNRWFMEERTDILNPLHKNMSWLEWFRDVIRTNTFLWTQIKDLAPICRHR
jgi:predicted ATP-grasp superfamily ATP-dependent carboligase